MKKKLFPILLILLLLLTDYLYWTVEFPLSHKTPEEAQNAEEAQLWYYDEFATPHEIIVSEEDLPEILQALDADKVTRRPKFATMSDPFFYLYLHYPYGYTCMTVVENGDISINPYYDSDKRLYFDGGRELYQTLFRLVPQ